jgi:WD40 repeat protein
MPEGHTSPVHSVAVSADGQLLCSGGFDGTVCVWSTTSGARLHMLRADRPYERMNVAGVSGLTEAQHVALRTLGAVDGGN